MSTILVTGGGGFLGSHLCDVLLEANCDDTVICMDNFFTGCKSNISHLIDNPRFELIRHDITDPFNVEANQIYNLACPASPAHYQRSPINTIQTNVLGMTNALNVAAKTGARILQASTSEVYGDPEVHPQPEGYFGNVNPIGVRACYDEGKRCAETLCYDYKRDMDCDIRVARIFNTYGTRMQPDDGRAVSNFIVQALCGNNITVYGDGSQTRSFCYVSDLIDGLVKLMNSEYSDTPVNLGNPEEFTILQLAELIIELVDPSLSVTFEALPGDDPTQRRPDITLADSILSWKPTVRLTDGIVKTIDYFRKII